MVLVCVIMQVMYDVEFGPNIFAHCEQLLMGSHWSGAIQDVGQKFEGDPVEFRKALCIFSINVGFHFKNLKNDKQRVIAVCLFRETKGCKW